MELGSVETIVQRLNEAGVRYLVVGGLAVVAHGFVRFTADVDLVLDLATDNLDKAVAALAALGYRPRAPVPFHEFADPGARSRWRLEKGLVVFSLFSPEHPATEIDLFVDEPFEFAAAFERAERLELAPGVAATFVGFDDLIDMKRRAGRPHDHDDIEALTRIRAGRES